MEKLKPRRRRLLHRIHEELGELFHRRLVDYLRAISDRIDVILDLKYRCKSDKLVRAIEGSGYKGNIYYIQVP